VLGYLLWVILAVQRGMTLQIVGEVLLGEKGAMYDARFTYLPTVGGVTTLTQFGTASVILGAAHRFLPRLEVGPIQIRCTRAAGVAAGSDQQRAIRAHRVVSSVPDSRSWERAS
jgi:hypothetical protein